MSRFYEPDLGAEPDNPFARDAANELVRRSYWLDMNDSTLVMVMTQGCPSSKFLRQRAVQIKGGSGSSG